MMFFCVLLTIWYEKAHVGDHDTNTVYFTLLKNLSRLELEKYCLLNICFLHIGN